MRVAQKIEGGSGAPARRTARPGPTLALVFMIAEWRGGCAPVCDLAIECNFLVIVFGSGRWQLCGFRARRWVVMQPVGRLDGLWITC